MAGTLSPWGTGNYWYLPTNPTKDWGDDINKSDVWTSTLPITSWDRATLAEAIKKQSKLDGLIPLYKHMKTNAGANDISF